MQKFQIARGEIWFSIKKYANVPIVSPRLEVRQISGRSKSILEADHELTCGSRCPICGRGCICLINKRNTNSINSTRVSNNTCAVLQTQTQARTVRTAVHSLQWRQSVKQAALLNWVFIVQLFGIKLLSSSYFSVEVVGNAWVDVK